VSTCLIRRHKMTTRGERISAFQTLVVTFNMERSVLELPPCVHAQVPKEVQYRMVKEIPKFSRIKK